MERSREYEDIAATLAALRPDPQPAFAAELDQRVAAGFPRPPRAGRSPLAALAERFRGLSPERLLFTAGGTALAAIAIATVVVANVDSGPGPAAIEQRASEPPRSLDQPAEAGPAAKQGDSSSLQSSGEYPSSSSSAAAAAPLTRTHRNIERSAEIDLLAAPADVADDSARVFDAVHDAGGIVLRSSTTGRSTGRAGAHFDLLIPSAKLGDALAAFSAIDEVSSRHEATLDITAPTVSLGEQLQDSRAKIAGLLSRLSAAETESEGEAIEIELRSERRHAAQLRSRLSRLHQRATFSRVSLRIETDDSAAASSDSWGIGDALHDAGRFLAVAAGVTVIGLAILAPLALLCLFAWFAQRLWIRRRRQQALN